MFSFFKDNFDKILLSFLFLVIFSADLHMAYHRADASVVAWGRESAGTILGGLLGLITGLKIASKSDKD